MKNNLQTTPLILKMIVLVTCFVLTIIYNQSQASHEVPVAVNKVLVNFEHNVIKKELKISIKSNTVIVMRLFLFSPEGVLIKEVFVSAQKITTIQDVKKGLYFFECFDNDTRMERGSLLLK